MNSTRSFGVPVTDRLMAFFLLMVLWPPLMAAALLILVTSGGSILVTDEITTREGAAYRSLRFRTTGHGKPTFHSLGRLYRRYSIDEMPALLSVVRGDIRLRDVLKFLMPKRAIDQSNP